MKEKLRRLPDSELAVMQALWRADAPLTRPELDAALNMDDSHSEADSISEEKEEGRRPSVLADLKARTGYSPISKRETEREEAVL